MRTWKPSVPAFPRFPAVWAIATALALASFAADPASPFRYWDPGDTATVPKTLSAMKLYAGTPGKNAPLIPQAVRYDVNVPAWNDGAVKRSWVLLKPGRTIGFREKDDYWDYPDSAVFVQEFALDTVPGDPASRVLLETRILLNKKDTLDANGTLSDHWHGYSYKWRKGQGDADRVSLTRGLDTAIRVWPDGAGAGKVSALRKWHFPNIYQCMNCHQSNPSESDSTHGRSVLGFFAAQLNRPDPDSAGLNQLGELFRKGVLTGGKPASWDAAPRWQGPRDSAFGPDAWAGLDSRARAYLAANCSGCHGRRGVRNGSANGVDINFDFHAMEARIEYANHWAGSGDVLKDVPPLYYPKDHPNNPEHLDSLRIVPALAVPGYPEKSLLYYRMKRRNVEPGNYDNYRDQMPPLTAYEADTAGLALIAEWIRKMPSPAATGLRGAPRTARAPALRLQGRLLRFDPAGQGGDRIVAMASLDGRRVELRRLAAGVYELPAGLPKGLYLIRAGTGSFLTPVP